MDTFCVLPWYSKEIFRDHSTPCCLLPRNTDIDNLKQDLLSGKKPAACAKCWRLEDQNLSSRRQQENQFLDYKLNRDLSLIKQDCLQGKNEILVYQIILSNLCNQACVTCQSAFSTKWSEIETRQGKVPKSRYELDLHNENIDYVSARRINLLGGEPLFDPKTFELLQRLVEVGNTDCFISFVTNGSQRLTDKQLALFKQFSDVNICVSIDGIQKVFEYMRWPGKWDQLLTNIEQYKSVAPNLSVSYTISSLNALYYDETVSWFNSQKIAHNHNVVTVPQWLSLEQMPVELKEYFSNHKFFAEYCTINGSEITISDMLREIHSQDQAKNIKIDDYMPEVWHLLNSLSK